MQESCLLQGVGVLSVRDPGWLVHIVYCLRVKSRRETDRGPKLPTELFPEPGGELWTPVGHNVDQQTIEMEVVIHQQLCGLPGRVKAWPEE